MIEVVLGIGISILTVTFLIVVYKALIIEGEQSNRLGSIEKSRKRAAGSNQGRE